MTTVEMTTVEMTTVELAAQEWTARKSRQTHPAGRADRGGRWYPAPAEEMACCLPIREPSRAYPWSLAHHCRSAAHVAALYGVDVREVRRAARAQAE